MACGMRFLLKSLRKFLSKRQDSQDGNNKFGSLTARMQELFLDALDTESYSSMGKKLLNPSKREQAFRRRIGWISCVH